MIVVNDLCKEFERTVVLQPNTADHNEIQENQAKHGKGKRGKLKQKKESFLAVDHISFEVSKGEILGILGPNGAGKTTLLRMLGGLMQPTSGTVAIKDSTGKLITDPVEYKRAIGYLSGNTRLYHRMSTREMLYMLADIYEIPRDEVEQRIAEISRVLDMSSFLDNRIEKQRAYPAFLHDLIRTSVLYNLSMIDHQYTVTQKLCFFQIMRRI